MKFWKRLWTMCWHCPGARGVVYEKGRRLRKDEMSPLDRADCLVNGGFVYEAIEKECPKCGGTGSRK